MSEDAKTQKQPDIICDFCKTNLTKQEFPPAYVDGKTHLGPWANMCIKCWNLHGVGLGIGKGQIYTWNPTSKRYTKSN